MKSSRIEPGGKHLTAADVADEMYKELAETFPVSSASDEFYFFPQVKTVLPRWSDWDDYSTASVAGITGKLAGWEQNLRTMIDDSTDRDLLIDCLNLSTAARTLREELNEVRPYRRQPTYLMTVLAIGLAEALHSDDRGAWRLRVMNLPDFIEQAGAILDDVPDLFRDLGLEMIGDLMSWIGDLEKTRPELAPVMQALCRYEARIKELPAGNGFLLPGELFDRLLRDHLGCRGGVDECLKEIDREIEDMLRVLECEAKRLSPGRTWLEASREEPHEILPAGGMLELYRREVGRLERHCLGLGMITPEEIRSCTVRVMPVPSYLQAVRTADAYSSMPGYPPKGGTFWVLGEESGRTGSDRLPREHALTAAHETYPGHHLLDIRRWGIKRTVRRPLERPLFYEGWACFAEEIMADTGYFTNPWDRFILARRRLKRAVRGKVDLGLQSGQMDLDAVSGLLIKAGLTEQNARLAARKYVLRPGYQVCYTVGLRAFLRLFERYGHEDVSCFARDVLGQGEIGFDALEHILASGNGPEKLE